MARVKNLSDFDRGLIVGAQMSGASLKRTAQPPGVWIGMVTKMMSGLRSVRKTSVNRVGKCGRLRMFDDHDAIYKEKQRSSSCSGECQCRMWSDCITQENDTGLNAWPLQWRDLVALLRCEGAFCWHGLGHCLSILMGTVSSRMTIAPSMVQEGLMGMKIMWIVCNGLCSYQISSYLISFGRMMYHPLSRVSENSRISAMVQWSCCIGTWWPSTLLRQLVRPWSCAGRNSRAEYGQETFQSCEHQFYHLLQELRPHSDWFQSCFRLNQDQFLSLLNKTGPQIGLAQASVNP